MARGDVSIRQPERKAAARARAAKVRGRYDLIQAKAQDTRGAYEPFIRDLNDLGTYLSNDLTPAAIQAAGPVFEKVKASGQVLKQTLDDIAAEISPNAPGERRHGPRSRRRGVERVGTGAGT